MNVDQCMSRDPKSCRAYDTLERAAQVMWEADCGCVPVLDEASRVVGMITDRDICMAAYTRGSPLYAITVESTMSRDVECCRPGDTLQNALKSMRRRQVRRLPVVDAAGGLMGVISMSDLAQHGGSQGPSRTGRLAADEVLSALSAITHPRSADSRDGFDRGGDRASSAPSPASVIQPRARTTASSSKSSHRSR